MRFLSNQKSIISISVSIEERFLSEAVTTQHTIHVPGRISSTDYCMECVNWIDKIFFL